MAYTEYHNEEFYIDVEKLIETCLSEDFTENEVFETGEITEDGKKIHIEFPSMGIDTYKYDIFRQCIDKVMGIYPTEVESEISIIKSRGQSDKSYTLAFNTLKHYEIIKEIKNNF